MYLGMALVFVAGYLIIYNVFQISITADIQFYGRLKTLGTDNKQIRRMIYGQGMRLSLIGIPAGLMIGYLVGALLVPVFISFSQENARVPVSPVCGPPALRERFLPWRRCATMERRGDEGRLRKAKKALLFPPWLFPTWGVTAGEPRW